MCCKRRSARGQKEIAVPGSEFVCVSVVGSLRLSSEDPGHQLHNVLLGEA